MRRHLTLLGLALAGAIIYVALREIGITAYWSGFEDPAPPLLYRLMWVWTSLLILVPGVVVGFLATRRAAWLGAVAYLLGAIASFAYHDGEREVPHHFLPGLKYWPYLLRELVEVALVGAVVAWISAWLRRRLTFVGADTRRSSA
jgi:hypothetical protein